MAWAAGRCRYSFFDLATVRTIRLDGGEFLYILITKAAVQVRYWDTRRGLIRALLLDFPFVFGRMIYYNESDGYKNALTAQALALLFPDQAPELQLKNPILALFFRGAERGCT
jgi:hypothetical protein